MDKERKPITTDDGFSENELDLAVDKSANNDQVKPARNASASVAGGGGSIFDPQTSKKKKAQK